MRPDSTSNFLFAWGSPLLLLAWFLVTVTVVVTFWYMCIVCCSFCLLFCSFLKLLFWGFLMNCVRFFDMHSFWQAAFVCFFPAFLLHFLVIICECGFAFTYFKCILEISESGCNAHHNPRGLVATCPHCRNAVSLRTFASPVRRPNMPLQNMTWCPESTAWLTQSSKY